MFKRFFDEMADAWNDFHAARILSDTASVIEELEEEREYLKDQISDRQHRLDWIEDRIRSLRRCLRQEQTS